MSAKQGRAQSRTQQFYVILTTRINDYMTQLTLHCSTDNNACNATLTLLRLAMLLISLADGLLSLTYAAAQFG